MCDSLSENRRKIVLLMVSTVVFFCQLFSSSLSSAEQFVISPGYKTTPSASFTISPSNVVYRNGEGTVYHVQADGPFEITMQTSNTVSGAANLIRAVDQADADAAESPIYINSISCRIGAYTDIANEVTRTDEHHVELRHAFNPNDHMGISSYHRSIPLGVGLSVSVNYSWVGADGEPHGYTASESIDTSITLSLTAFNKYSWGSDGNTLFAEAYTLTVNPSNGEIIYTPQPGVQVTPQGDDYTFFPGSATTSFNPNVSNGETAVAMFTVKTPIGLHIENDVSGSTIPITVSIDSYETTRPVPASFATITRVIGDVITKDQLSGEAVPAHAGMRLAPGTQLTGTVMSNNQGGYVYPSVTIQYCDGTEEVVNLAGLNGQSTVSTVGSTSTTVSGKQYSRFDLAVKQLSFDVMNNPREIVRKGVSSAFGKLAGALTGGWGWVASDAAGGVTEYAIDSYSKSLRSKNKNAIVKSSSPAVPLEQEMQGERYSWAFYEDGTYLIENDGPSLLLSTSGGDSFLVPAHTVTKFPAGSRLSSGRTEALYPYVEYKNPQVITPASGSTVSRTPTITIDHIGQYSTIMKGSVACWLNGVNIAHLMQKNGESKFYDKVGLSIFTVPPEMRLPEGENTIEVRVYDHKGVKFTGESTFTATGKPETPTSLVSFAGTDKITLRWKENREHDVHTYRIYRAENAETAGTLILETNQPVFVDHTPDEAEQWYSVSAVDNDAIESKTTKAIYVATSTEEEQHVAAVSSAITVTAQHHAILINWLSFPGGTACWKLERAEDGQDFITLSDEMAQDVLGVLKFTDHTAEVGTQYNYRVKPLSGQLTEGSPFTSTSLTPLDLLPTAPGAVTVDREGNNALLRWNANTDSGVIGYKLYMGKNDAELTLAGEELLQGTSFKRSILGNMMYYFSLVTVDAQGREGTMSSSVELSTWGSGLPSTGNFPWSMFLPAIFSEHR